MAEREESNRFRKRLDNKMVELLADALYGRAERMPGCRRVIGCCVQACSVPAIGIIDKPLVVHEALLKIPFAHGGLIMVGWC